VSLLELEFLDTFFKFFMEGDQKGNLLDEVIHFSKGLLVYDGDVFGKILEGDHNFIERVSFEHVS
jgi:hypothetical protein